MNKTLPVGWIMVNINEIGNIVYGKGIAKKNISNNGNFPVFGANAIIGYHNSFTYENPQILISCRGANSGKINISPKNCFVTSNSLVLELPDIICNEYKFLYYALIITNKSHIVTGSAQPQVTIENLKKIAIPMPSLNEQKRIVERLDKITPRIDAVKSRLEKIPSLIKRFKQSILNAAVTGKLTEKWREEHPDVESAEILLEKLKKERIINAASSDQKNKIEEIFSETETGDNDSLPFTWNYTYLNKLCNSFQYGTSSKSQKKGNVPVIRMGNLQNGVIDWNDLVFTSDEDEIKKYSLKPGDVLFNRTNSPELVGKTSIYKGERQAIYAGYLIKINNYSQLFSPYLNYALNSYYAKSYCNQVKSDGVNQSNINAQKLGKFEIPLPPIEEQEEIVRQVDKYFALADTLETHYKNAKEKVDKLTQSVLAKAFRGELVTPEAILAEKEGREFESAEQLLERIINEKNNK